MSSVELRKTFQESPVEITSTGFDFYSADEIRHMSVKEITKGTSFDLLGNQELEGLYDPALGVFGKNTICPTCGLTEEGCPGHFGHFELEEPMYQPLLLTELLKLLRSICMKCHSLKASKQVILGAAIEFERLAKNDIEGAMDIHGLVKEAQYIQRKANASRGKLKREQIEDEENLTVEREVDKELESIFKKECGKGIKKDISFIHTDTHCKAVRNELIAHMVALKDKPCPYCKTVSPKIVLNDSKTGFVFYGENTDAAKNRSEHKYETTPSYIMNILKEAWGHNEIQNEVLSRMYYSQMRGGEKLDVIVPSYHMFFVEVLPIPPSRFRQLNKFGDLISDHPQSIYYRTIIESSNALKVRREGTALDYPEKYFIDQMQKAYNLLILTGNADEGISMKSILEHKKGLFRNNMMGKRVNYAARTVISPDPFLPTNTIGMPLPFAMRLTIAVPVNERNYEEMKQAVINGPQVWPGALYIENEWGHKIVLLDDSNPYNKTKRQGEAERLLVIDPKAPRSFKTVFRHVIDNDMVLSNRQPTLHKPGIMGHYVKVLKIEKTIRMHYANCNTFNADFDGDEMNLHLPQSMEARSEVMNIALSDEQYVVPKNGQPLRGLIQDHVISSFMLTKRDTFFTKEEYCQIVYTALYGIYEQYSIRIPMPAILKPIPKWTGKQVVTAILMHISTNHCTINFEGKCKVSTNEINRGGYQTKKERKLMKQKDEFTEKWSGANDSLCIIKDSQMLTGTLDKNQIGASNQSLIHAIYELYNGKVSGMCLTLLSRLLTTYLQRIGHTCSLDDCMLKPEFDNKRTEMLNKTNELARTAIAKHFKLEGHSKYDIDLALANARRRPQLSKELDDAVKTEVNECTSNVIKECIPYGQLRAFPWNSLALMTTTGAKGSKVNHSQITCLLGQQELEGRRVPVMATGKTLPSFPRYDTSARAGGFIASRFLTGVPPQEFFFHCMAGREGLIDTAVKTASSGYLQRCVIKMLESLHVEYDYSVRESDGSIIEFMYGDDGIDVMKSGFLNNIDFWANNYDALVSKYETKAILSKFKKGFSRACKLQKKCLRHPEKYEPVQSIYSPSNNLAAVSEKYYKLINDYIKEDKRGEFKSGKLDPETFKVMMMLKYNKSLINPGEPVGVLAGQSIGEPSTQMTLNTFHLAGRGDVNVTLGMPRIKELVMFAKKEIATPSMILYLKEPNQKNTEKLAKLLTKVTLANIIEGIKCLDSIIVHEGQRRRQYTIDLTLIDKYEEVVDFNTTEITKKIKSVLMNEIAKRQQSKVGIDIDYKGVSGEEAEEKVNEESEDVQEKINKGKVIEEEVPEEEQNEMSEEEIETEEKSGSSSSSEEEEKEEKKSPLEEEKEEIKEKPNVVEKEEKGKKQHLVVSVLLNVNDKVSMVSVVEKVIEKIILYECPHIVRGIPLSKKKEGRTIYYVMTEGVNFRAALQFGNLVDVDTVETNDVYAVLNMYGVEAARTVLIHEIDSVFKAYGIDVDPRHLNLVADYMMYEGEYKSLNRSGMDHNPSPFTKITFETSLGFLAKTCVSGQKDNLRSPSGSVVMGKNMVFGTGAFDIYTELSDE
ncbi:DNA-directed RNA polymerase I subunit RPA1, putative [Entamoeba histolytica KU27]|uniref:DNA-directed RNA polymerase subunit n=1 Tax=Entamoeba histolytica KU27 TaxID=885311 RepID=M2RTP6_ENTHI|nr:DNA-directed RNA polymerase I subunit RPA1, putative [Entamoeba histolytica KU27]